MTNEEKKLLELLLLKQQKENIKDDCKIPEWRFKINKLDFFNITGQMWPENCNFDRLQKLAIDYINYRTQNILLKHGDSRLCPWQINLLKQIIAELMLQICCQGESILKNNNDYSSESLGQRSVTYKNTGDEVDNMIKQKIKDLHLEKLIYVNYGCGCSRGC